MLWNITLKLQNVMYISRRNKRFREINHNDEDKLIEVGVFVREGLEMKVFIIQKIQRS